MTQIGKLIIIINIKKVIHQKQHRHHHHGNYLTAAGKSGRGTAALRRRSPIIARSATVPTCNLEFTKFQYDERLCFLMSLSRSASGSGGGGA
jgi:hypothetical protein